MRDKILDYLERNRKEFLKLSSEIHSNPEIGNEEKFACELLTEYLKEKGFQVKKGIAGHPTGFIARKSSSNPEKKKSPKLGFLAEYDALPGLGHACGHNIIGASAVAAGVALSSVLEVTGGEVIIYGCPSEEGGENGSAKATYVKEGLFQEVDACMSVHPGCENTVTKKTLALNPLDFEFFGKSAHAAGSPEEGINALDAMLHLFSGIASLRQHLTSDVKIHGVITHGGTAPNIIPDYTKARFYLRASTKKGCDLVTEKVEKIAEGAALMTGCKVKITQFQNRVDNIAPTEVFDELYIEVMKELGVEVSRFSEKGFGSTDVGNVSQIVPVIHPFIKICNEDIIPHTTEFTAAANSCQGEEAVILGGKALALVGLELLQNPEKLETIKINFQKS